MRKKRKVKKKSIREQREKEWLSLLKIALKRKRVHIKLNHGFKYKEKNLGSFLIDAKKRNKKELLFQIESLGFSYKDHSRDPEDYIESFILKLENDKDPNKQKYITTFNMYILPKKDILKEETKERLNKVWKNQFKDVRKWTKPETTDDRIISWKNFRYNKEINPDEKWLTTKKVMGKLHGWVYSRKTNKYPMDELIKYFNQTELEELKQEGFLINKE